MQTIRVLSVNLRFGLADDGLNRWEYRKKAMAELLRAWPADFVCTQEVNDFQAEFLSGVLEGYGQVGMRPDAPFRWQHNMVFHAPGWQVNEWSRFYLSDTPDQPSQFSESKWPRQFSYGRFSQNGKKVCVACTHFDFLESVQEKSARLILSRMQEVKEPMVLAGDFNAPPCSAAHRVLLGQAGGEPETPGPFFSDSLGDECQGGTHHGFTGKADPEIGRIDWILHRGAILAQGTEIITRAYDNRWPTDHFPVVAEFGLE